MLININMKRNSWRAWMLAARPKTLTGALVPVMLGIACAYHSTQGTCFTSAGSLADSVLGKGSHIDSIVAALLCVLFALVMQIESNFVNDYFDFVKGKDNEERLGPLRACQQGWVTLRAMRIAIAITAGLAAIVGTPLILFGGYELIIVGAACLLFCFLYTVCMASIGMGDLLVLVFFGIVPVCFTYYVVVPPSLQTFSTMPWLTGTACGLVVDTLLIVNNYRDIDNDRHSGKHTLVTMIGKEKTEWMYLSLVPMAVILLLWQYGWTNFNMIISFGIYFLHIDTWNKMRRISQGRELNKVLGKTARNIFVFGILASLVVIMS